MKIRIARDGAEIAQFESMDMLIQVVESNSVRLDDHAFIEGSENWILVQELLDDQGAGRKSITPIESVAPVSPHDPFVDIIRPTESQAAVSGKSVGPVNQHRGYVLPMLFFGATILIILFAFLQRERPLGLPDISLGASSEVRQAAKLFTEADDLYRSATTKWYNDDETLITKALRRYESAWQLLHNGVEYPEGALITDSQEAKLLRDELKDNIKECREQTNWLPWPW